MVSVRLRCAVRVDNVVADVEQGLLNAYACERSSRRKILS